MMWIKPKFYGQNNIIMDKIIFFENNIAHYRERLCVVKVTFPILQQGELMAFPIKIKRFVPNLFDSLNPKIDFP